MKKNFKNTTILVILSITIILYLINANYVIDNIIEYSKLFFTKIFPVSFIFFTFSTLLIDYGLINIFNKYLHINASNIYVFILSMISGFPSGAKYTKELLKQKYISKEDANKIIMYAHFPNPLFILGSVNLVLNDKILSLKILLSIIISNLIILILNKNTKSTINQNYIYPSSFQESLTKAIKNTFEIILLIYGTSLFFNSLSTIISKYLILNKYLYILINGIFDLTKGVFSTILIENNIIKSLFITLFISFGGISINMQVKSIISNTEIKYINFIKGRVLSTILSLIILLLLTIIN